MGEGPELRLPRVSLVLAVYDRSRFLDLVLTSLERQTLEDFEVVVADDGSGTDVRRVIESFEGRFRHGLRHVWHPHDGFRKSVIVNRAVERARGALVVFADGDCLLHRRFLERHWVRRGHRTVQSGRRVMLGQALSARLTREDVRSGHLERPWFWLRGSQGGSRRRGFYLPWLYGPNQSRRSDYTILGSNFSLHREEFLEVNGYDERIVGRGLEDSNLEVRLKLAGCSVNNVSGEAIQYHLFHTSAPLAHDSFARARFLAVETPWTPFGVQRQSEAIPAFGGRS